MFFFIFTLIVLLTGVAAIAGAAVFRNGTSGAVGTVALLLGGVFMVVSCVDQVPTRNVGIVVSGQKPTGRTTGAGWITHKPWEHVDEWDASRNTYDRLGDRCLWVSVSGGRACIAVQVEWSAKAENAPQDWASYKAVGGIDGGRFGTFVARRVNPQMDAAITTAFTAFNPLGQVDPATGALKAPDLNKDYRDALMGTLTANLGDSVTIDSIAFGTPTYDKPTTDAISAFGQKTLESRNLAVDEANAKTRARITATDASVDQVARCLQIAEKLGKEPGLCMNPLGALAQTSGK